MLCNGLVIFYTHAIYSVLLSLQFQVVLFIYLCPPAITLDGTVSLEYDLVFFFFFFFFFFWAGGCGRMGKHACYINCYLDC